MTSKSVIAGVDEAGRGPLAGPVYVAAVVLDPKRAINGLDDSKRLSAKRRDALYPLIIERALAYCVIAVQAAEIDEINILQATMVGMSRALRGLPCAFDEALIDGNRIPADVPCAARALIGGDGLEACISAASILAKVERDRYLLVLEQRYPGYGFAKHKGYGTREHLDALQRLGPCLEHRRSFAPVRAALRSVGGRNCPACKTPPPAHFSADF